MGASRQHYYDIKAALEEEGVEGLVEKSRRAPRIANRIDGAIEDKILAYSLENPTHGQGDCIERVQEARDREESRALEEAREMGRREHGVLSENQVQALESAKEEKQATAKSKRFHAGFLVGQDTFYAAWIKGIGKIYQQTAIDTFSNVAFAKLYIEKTALAATDFLNDRVLTFFDSHGIRRGVADGTPHLDFSRALNPQAKSKNIDELLRYRN
ncbi:unnamed protein product [Sphagnum balticum]